MIYDEGRQIEKSWRGMRPERWKEDKRDKRFLKAFEVPTIILKGCSQWEIWIDNSSQNIYLPAYSDFVFVSVRLFFSMSPRLITTQNTAVAHWFAPLTPIWWSLLRIRLFPCIAARTPSLRSCCLFQALNWSVRYCFAFRLCACSSQEGG